MTAFARRVAEVTGLSQEAFERLSGGDLSEVLLFRRPDGRRSVAKGGPSVATEAAMLRGLAAAGMPAPSVEAEHDGVLILEYVPNDGVFSTRAWASVGSALRNLHGCVGESYGWPVDYHIGSVALDNRPQAGWRAFWVEQRLLTTASVLDLPWRERIERAARNVHAVLPSAPRPSLLHGDLWSGNILVREGALSALIDPACYHGDAEVDLAMLTLFDAPAGPFWEAYGDLEPGWQERRAAYQLFPALVHLRLFGASYAGMVDRLLRVLGS